jgi:hypothetical protein
MRRTRAQGFVEITGPSGSVTRETYTCCHCNRLDFVPETGATELGFCHRCMARECVPCAKKLGGRCRPFEEKLQQMEARGKLFLAAGIVAFVVVVLGAGTARAQSTGVPSTGSPACVRENGCSFTPCYGALPGGAVAHYFCDCKTTGAAGQQPASGCTAGSDAANGLTPATAKQTYSAAEALFSSLNADDRILFCNGGVFDATGAGSTRWVNRNATAAHPVVAAGGYDAAWGGGGARYVLLNPLAAYLFNLDDGSDISRGGYIFAGGRFEGIGQPATACASSSPFPMEAFFAYDQVNDVLICDSSLSWQCIGMEIAGGNNNSDDNQRITIRNSLIVNNDAQGVLGSGSSILIDRNLFDYNGKAASNLDHNIYYSSGLSTGAVISNNELYRAAPVGGGGCAGVSLVIHGILDGLTISGNWIHEPVGTAGSGCYGVGIMPGYTTGEQFNHVTVNGNYFQDMGGSGVEVVACHNCNITNNIMVGSPTSGFEAVTVTNDSVGTGDWTDDTILVAGNTVYGNGLQFRETNGTGSADPTRITFANNVGWQTGSGTVNCFDHSLANADYTAMNGNWCYAPSGSTVNWNATGSQSLATWRANGWDLNSTYGTTPGFTTATLTATMTTVSAAFLPTGVSGLVAGGQTALGPTTDFLGLSRPQRGTITIGALELAAVPTVTKPAGIYGMFLLTLFVLGAASLAGALSVKRHRAERADAQHVHLIDEHTQAALAEMGDDDALSLILRAKCDDCGEPAFLPRKKRGG